MDSQGEAGGEKQESQEGGRPRFTCGLPQELKGRRPSAQCSTGQAWADVTCP